MATRNKAALESAPISVSAAEGGNSEKPSSARSSLELRVLPSFDPRVKLLVEMMGRIDMESVKEGAMSAVEAKKVRDKVAQLLEAEKDNIKKAGLEIKIVAVGVGGDGKPKSLEQRLSDFLPVAARIIKGKHPDFAGWLSLSQGVLVDSMVKYINFFYGKINSETPGETLKPKIVKLIALSDKYFDRLLQVQGNGNGKAGGDNASGYENIKGFLDHSDNKTIDELLK